MSKTYTISNFKTALLTPITSKWIDNSGMISRAPKPTMFISIFSIWILAILWYHPRLWALMEMASTPMSQIALGLFIIFIEFAWLYGIYNIMVLVFAFIYKYTSKKPQEALSELRLSRYPEVAILYTTCNDFVQASVESCIKQDYPNYRLYILDDSSDDFYKQQVDDFAARHPERITVVRRPDRKGFKAGNMNHGLTHFAHEPYFAIADADEILPEDFLSKLVPIMEADDRCGFVQANHQVNPDSDSALSKTLGRGIDIHWRYYQPYRNDYGFVMFLGHGALLRRKAWEEIGGFPDIVSEDLGFAIHAREKGYRGRFLQNVICYEDFPDTVRSFRVRHMKWTRGTSEFLHKKFKWLINAKNITWAEKLDILFPTLNLPLTFVYLFFMVVANLFIPYLFGIRQDLTFELGGFSLIWPIYVLPDGFSSIYTWDFFLITMMTFFAPVLCFIIGFIRTPWKLVKFISHSTAMYAALGPLSSIGVLAYMISGKAIFLVTGDTKRRPRPDKSFVLGGSLKNVWKKFINRSHPDTSSVQFIEVIIGLLFAAACIAMFQISFFGLCLAFMFMPLLHRVGWENKLMRMLAHLPFIFIVLGILLAGANLVGMQTVFFGYGFHF